MFNYCGITRNHVCSIFIDFMGIFHSRSQNPFEVFNMIFVNYNVILTNPQKTGPYKSISIKSIQLTVQSAFLLASVTNLLT